MPQREEGPPKTISTIEIRPTEQKGEHLIEEYDEENGFLSTHSRVSTASFSEHQYSETTIGNDDTNHTYGSALSTPGKNVQWDIKKDKVTSRRRNSRLKFRATDDLETSLNDVESLNENDSDTYSSAVPLENKGSVKKKNDTPEDVVQQEIKDLAKRKTINRMKIVVIVMLFVAAILVTMLVWYFSMSAQKKEFKSQYDTLSQKVVKAFVHNLDMKIWTAYTLSSVFTSRYGPTGQEIHHGATWPNVTMPDFFEQSKGSIRLAHADDLFFAPLLTNETIASWTAYAEDIHISGKHDGTHHKSNEEVIVDIESENDPHGHKSTSHHSGHERRSLLGDTLRRNILSMYENETILGEHNKTMEDGYHGDDSGEGGGDNLFAQKNDTMHGEAHQSTADEAAEQQCDSKCPCCVTITGFANAINRYSQIRDGCSHEIGSDRDVITVETCEDDDAVVSFDFSSNFKHFCGTSEHGSDDTIFTNHEESVSCLTVIRNALKRGGDGQCNSSLRCDGNHGGHEELNHGSNSTMHDDGTGNVTMQHNSTVREGHHSTDNEESGNHGNDDDGFNTTTHHNSSMGEGHHSAGHKEGQTNESHSLPWGIYRIDQETQTAIIEDTNDPYYFPTWQIIPEEGNEAAYLFNAYSDDIRKEAIDSMIDSKHTTMTSFLFRPTDYKILDEKYDDHDSEPTTIVFSPIFRDFTMNEIVGVIGLDFNWKMNFMGLLPGHVGEMCIVLESSLGEVFSFMIRGNRAIFEGQGDLHDRKYDENVVEKKYEIPDVYADDIFDHMSHSGGNSNDHLSETSPTISSSRSYTLRIYPSHQFHNEYVTKAPAIFALVVALIFFFTSLTFILYDCLVENRQEVVMKRAVQSGRVVHSLFPATVRERMFTAQQEKENLKKGSINATSNLVETPTVRLRNFLMAPATSGGSVSVTNTSENGGEPIADMFPETTILFADIAGFTAWSSEREPHQVFELLETIYKDFDLEAMKHGVFKIETIGDCYVAATGLPHPQDDHAVIMSRFAQRCLIKFRELTNEMAITLGPGTANLGLRIGIHSGAVTAGVLRGEKSRFQVFGDTMNTASRMESSGKKNMIQISPETKALLGEAGKCHWTTQREDIVVAKGKGEIQTYWLRPRAQAQRRGSAISTSSADYEIVDWGRDLSAVGTAPLSDALSQGFSPELQHRTAMQSYEDEIERLVKWNASVLEDLLIKVMSHRLENSTLSESSTRTTRRLQQHRWSNGNKNSPSGSPTPGGNDISNHRRVLLPKDSISGLLIDEIDEEVPFEPYNPWTAGTLGKSKNLDSIGEVASNELVKYVARIAGMYRNVHFHNFEHASHVTMSANKLMKKVCARNWSGYSARIDKSEAGSPVQINLFFKTFGISADPLAQFAVVFAALVHDVDHLGVPNVQVIKEAPGFASKYKNISVAEQNSIHVAWELLLEPDFENLRKCMFVNEYEMQRFKHLLIHIIMATDIADKKRMKVERERWDKAFCNFSSWEDEWSGKSNEELRKVDVSLKATAVLEQLMLASDIAHTMQHWITFVKWNERLFKERMVAFMEGRADADPRIDWYNSELGFFDFYIIPLATRLKDCGVFGSAGDEYLGYALKNRQEWTEKGKDIVKNYYKWSIEQGAKPLLESSEE